MPQTWKSLTGPHAANLAQAGCWASLIIVCLSRSKQTSGDQHQVHQRKPGLRLACLCLNHFAALTDLQPIPNSTANMEKQNQPMSQVQMDNGHGQQQYHQQPQQYSYSQPNANQAYGAAQPMNVNGPQASGPEVFLPILIGMIILDICGQREWKVGTFDAFPANVTCLKACFVPCLHYGHSG